MQKFYVRGGASERGPISQDQLKQLAESGQLQPDSLVRTAERNEWVRADEVRGLKLAPVETVPSPVETKPRVQGSTDRAAHRRYLRTGSTLMRIPLLLMFGAGLLCIAGAFIGEATAARVQLFLSIGFSALVSSGLAMLFCRMADVLADISEMLDSERH